MAALEFCLPPRDLPRLLRNAVFARRTGRAAQTEIVWHDTASGSLASDHLSLGETRGQWRLARLAPRAGDVWPPGTPAPLLAEAADMAELGPLPGPLMPIAGFRGERRLVRLKTEEPATILVLNGVLRGVAQEKPVCRLILEGPAPLLAALSTDWAATLPLAIPACSLALEAICLARGLSPAPRRSGGPEVSEGMTVADAIALVTGHLTDVILSGVLDAAAGQSANPVHAMRVAVRRLRSALSVFRRVGDGPAFETLKTQLGDLARVLGGARDWDVFLAGMGQDVAAAMPDEPRIQALLAAAAKRREAAYATLRREFTSPGFRRLTMDLVQLSALRPWEIGADGDRLERLGADIGGFASEMLTRRYDQFVDAGADISRLPAEDLHTLRKQGKRLRYMAEFFAPLYGRRATRRFLDRVSQLQEALGHLNDGAAAAALMQALRGDADRQFAAGAVQGFAAARSMDSRQAIARRWAKMRQTKPFWR